MEYLTEHEFNSNWIAYLSMNFESSLEFSLKQFSVNQLLISKRNCFLYIEWKLYIKEKYKFDFLS